MQFHIACDRAWRVRRVEAAAIGDERRIVLVSDGVGHWCDDSGQPQTMSPRDRRRSIGHAFHQHTAVRRLGLAAGQSADIRPVYIRMPEYEVTTDRNAYTCIEPGRRCRYESLDSDFVRDNEVDEHGLVVTSPGLFRRLL